MKKYSEVKIQPSRITRFKRNFDTLCIGVIIGSLAANVFLYNIWPKIVSGDNILYDIILISPALVALAILVYGYHKRWDLE